MSNILKQWLKLRSKNQRLYDSIISAIKKSVQNNPPFTVINLVGDKQLRKSLFVFDIIVTLDMFEQLVDKNTNAYHVEHKVISIDFIKFDIINDKEISILTDTQNTLLRNSVDEYLRKQYTI